MKPLSQLVRPNIQALQPYSTARDEYAGGGRLEVENPLEKLRHEYRRCKALWG